MAKVTTDFFIREAKPMQAMMDLAIPNAKHTFESLFGVSPIVCMDVWTICVFREGTTPMHVLRALLFLKVTDEEVYLPIIANCTVESFEKWLPPTIKAIGDGCTHVIRWTDRLETGPFEPIGEKNCQVTVGSFDCPLLLRVEGLEDLSTIASYQVAICIQTGDMVWVEGPFAPGWETANRTANFIRVYRSGVKKQLRYGEMVVANPDDECKDRTVLNYPHQSRPHKMSEEESRAIDTALWRQEILHGRLREWRILSDEVVPVFLQYPRNYPDHGPCFRAVVVCEQLSSSRGERNWKD